MAQRWPQEATLNTHALGLPRGPRADNRIHQCKLGVWGQSWNAEQGLVSRRGLAMAISLTMVPLPDYRQKWTVFWKQYFNKRRWHRSKLCERATCGTAAVRRVTRNCIHNTAIGLSTRRQCRSDASPLVHPWRGGRRTEERTLHREQEDTEEVSTHNSIPFLMSKVAKSKASLGVVVTSTRPQEVTERRQFWLFFYTVQTRFRPAVNYIIKTYIIISWS